MKPKPTKAKAKPTELYFAEQPKPIEVVDQAVKQPAPIVSLRKYTADERRYREWRRLAQREVRKAN